MDDIRIWNYARTQQQLLSNQSVELNGNESGLVAYYRANEASGALVDSTVHQNHGILAGQAAFQIPNAIALWRFEDSFADASGNQNTLGDPLGSVAFDQGMYGKAVRFTGHSFLYGGSNRPALNSNQYTTYSMGAWIKSEGSGADQVILGQFYPNFGSGLTNHYGQLWAYNGGGGGYNAKVPNANLNDGNWHFVAMTFNTGTIRVYINGVERASNTVPLTTSAGSQEFSIGGRSGGTAAVHNFRGLIDEAFFSSSAMSAVQINALYQSQLNGGKLLAGPTRGPDQRPGAPVTLASESDWNANWSDSLISPSQSWAVASSVLPDTLVPSSIDRRTALSNFTNHQWTNQPVADSGDVRTAQWTPEEFAIAGDFNGDGRTDLAYQVSFVNGVLSLRKQIAQSNGTWLAQTNNITIPAANGQPMQDHLFRYAQTGDVNGDGRDDIVLPSFTVGTGVAITTLLAQADGTWQYQFQQSGLGPGNLSRVLMDDITGDGRDELVFLYDNNNQLHVSVIERNQTNNGWATAQLTQHAWGSGWWTHAVAGDVNGDGRSDIILPAINPYGNNEGLVVRTLLRQADGNWSLQEAIVGGTTPLQHVRAGDVNGDGFSDLVIPFLDPAQKVKTLFSDGSGSGWGVHLSHPQGSPGSEGPGWLSRILIGDTNNDSRADLIQLSSVIDASQKMYILAKRSGWSQDELAFANSINESTPYLPSVTGALASIDASFDFKVESGSALQPQLVLRQAGNFYRTTIPYRVEPTSAWQSFKRTSLVATDFVQINGTSHPDFSASAAPIYVGYSISNSPAKGSSGAFRVDNFVVTARSNNNSLLSVSTNSPFVNAQIDGGRLQLSSVPVIRDTFQETQFITASWSQVQTSGDGSFSLSRQPTGGTNAGPFQQGQLTATNQGDTNSVTQFFTDRTVRPALLDGLESFDVSFGFQRNGVLSLGPALRQGNRVYWAPARTAVIGSAAWGTVRFTNLLASEFVQLQPTGDPQAIDFSKSALPIEAGYFISGSATTSGSWGIDQFNIQGNYTGPDVAQVTVTSRAINSGFTHQQTFDVNLVRPHQSQNAEIVVPETETSFPSLEREPVIASDAAGNYIVVWAAVTGESGLTNSIRARHFTADGETASAEFEVASITSGSGSLSRPDVAMNANGQFVVTWLETVGLNRIIRAQRFNASQTTGVLFSELNRQHGGGFIFYNAAVTAAPKAAIAANGDAVFTWKGATPATADLTAIAYRRWPAPPVFVNTLLETANSNSPAVSGEKFDPVIAMQPDGTRFVISWAEAGSSSNAILPRIIARWFNASGTAITGEQAVANVGLTTPDATRAANAKPVVAVSSIGETIFAFHHQPATGANEIRANRYQWVNNAPTSRGTFVVTYANVRVNPSVLINEQGHVVSWHQGAAGDGQLKAVVSRYATGTSETISLNHYVTDNGIAHDLAWGKNSSLLVTWGSRSTVYQRSLQSSGGAIYGNLFDDTNFNSLQDPGEFQAFGISTYIDVNDNGIRELGESTTLSDFSGSFRFSGLPHESILVRPVVPTSSVLTTPVVANFVSAFAPIAQLSSIGLKEVLSLGPDRTIGESASVLVEIGNIQFDENAVYRWYLNDVLQTNATSASFQFGPANGTDPASLYSLRVEVTGTPTTVGSTGVYSSETLVYVLNEPPTASVSNTSGESGTPQGTDVTINVLASDPSALDQSQLRYFYSSDLAARNSATLNSPGTTDSASKVVLIPQPGEHTVYVRVFDPDGAYVDLESEFLILNAAPEADAGEESYSITAGQGSVTFNGSASSDPGNDPLFYSWFLVDENQVEQLLGHDQLLTLTWNQLMAVGIHSRGDHTIRLRVSDGELSDSVDTVFHVLNQSPVANPGVSYLISEGQSLTLNGGASSDPENHPLTFAWDIDNDGDFDDATGQVATVTWSQLESLGLSNGPGLHTIRLQVSDPFGGVHVSSLADNLQISNANPTANLIAPVQVTEGVPFTIEFANLWDVDADLSGLRFSVDLNNDGDFTDPGEVLADNSPIQSSLFYADNGTFRIRARITDNDGGETDYFHDIQVMNMAPTAVLYLSTGPHVNEGQSFTFGLTDIVDSPDDLAAGLLYSFDLNGDGLFELVDQPGPTQTLTILQNGLHRLRVRVADKDGAYSEYQQVLAINNVAPEITDFSVSTTSVDQGDTLVFSGTFADPGDSDDASQWTGNLVVHREGVKLDVIPVAINRSNKTFTASYTASTRGELAFSAMISDGDSQVPIPTNPIDVDVTNIAPTIDPISLPSTIQGQSYFGAIPFIDPGSDSWNWTVAYGDGNTSNGTISGSDRVVPLQHIYASAGNYSVVVTVNDDIDSATHTFDVHVAPNRAPVITKPLPSLLVTPETTSRPFYANLHQFFTDPDDSVTNLSFAVVDISNPAFASAVLDSQLPHMLHLNIDASLTGTSFITIRATDSAGEFADNRFAVTTIPLGFVPTDISLAQENIYENTSTATDLFFGQLSAIDADPGDQHIFELVSGSGDSDNAKFLIEENRLYLQQGEVLDYETQSQFSLRIRAVDNDGLWYEKPILVTIMNLLELTQTPVFGDGTSQRSSVRSITVEFDGPVEIQSSAFQLTRRGSAGGVVSTSFVTETTAAGGTRAIITFAGPFTRAGSLVDGNYQLRIGSTALSLPFDGNRDGLPGDDFTIGEHASDGFFAHYGDLTGDRTVSLVEFNQFRAAFGKTVGQSGYRAELDFNNDNSISLADFNQFRNRFGRSLPWE
jgi:hypothetical protein